MRAKSGVRPCRQRFHGGRQKSSPASSPIDDAGQGRIHCAANRGSAAGGGAPEHMAWPGAIGLPANDLGENAPSDTLWRLARETPDRYLRRTRLADDAFARLGDRRVANRACRGAVRSRKRTAAGTQRLGTLRRHADAKPASRRAAGGTTPAPAIGSIDASHQSEAVAAVARFVFHAAPRQPAALAGARQGASATGRQTAAAAASAAASACRAGFAGSSRPRQRALVQGREPHHEEFSRRPRRRGQKRRQAQPGATINGHGP